MTPWLYLAPAVAGTAALAALSLPIGRRVALVLGASFGLVLLAVSDSLDAWRTTEPGVAPALAAAGAALAFLLVLAAPGEPGPTAAQVGVASSALITFAAGSWAVPALLFWLVSSLAIASIVATSRRRATVWSALALSDAAVVGVVASTVLETESWALAAIEGWRIPVIIGAALLRAGAIPLSGQWPIDRATSATAVPLLVAGASVLVARFVSAPQPLFALGALVIGLIAAASAALWRFDMRSIGSFVVAVMLGLGVAIPSALAAAALAAVCAATAVALWPQARGRGRLTRGGVLAGAPPTIAFAAIAAAAVTAFDRSHTVSGLEGAAWAGIAGALPVALAAGVALGAMAARREPSDDFEPPAVIATWVVFAFSVVTGIWIGAFVPAGNAVVGGSTRALYLVALIAAVPAALRAPRSASHPAYSATEVLLSETLPPRPARLAILTIATVVGAGAVAGVTYLTVIGLRQGFLA